MVVIALVEAFLTCKTSNSGIQNGGQSRWHEGKVLLMHSQITPWCVIKFMASTRRAHQQCDLHKACRGQRKWADRVALTFADCQNLPDHSKNSICKSNCSRRYSNRFALFKYSSIRTPLFILFSFAFTMALSLKLLFMQPVPPICPTHKWNAVTFYQASGSLVCSCLVVRQQRRQFKALFRCPTAQMQLQFYEQLFPLSHKPPNGPKYRFFFFFKSGSEVQRGCRC